jgi:hypothetical protein
VLASNPSRAREFILYRLFQPQGKLRDNIRTNSRALYHSSKPFIHSQIIIINIEGPGRSSRRAPSLFSLVPRSAPRQCPTVGTALQTQPPRAAKRPRCLPVDGGSRAAAEATEAEPVRHRSSSGQATRCDRAVTDGIDQGADAATSLRPVASGRRQSDAERGIGSDPTLTVQGGVGGECRVINRRAGGWRSGLKRQDDVSEVAREHRQGEPGKGPGRCQRRPWVGEKGVEDLSQ